MDDETKMTLQSTFLC